MKKALTHIPLDLANRQKLAKLDAVAGEALRVVQAYCAWLIAHEVREPDKFAALPEREVPTSLSDRWQRCCWQQACGIVQSWYSNEHTTPPVLRTVCLQANANVVLLEKSKSRAFDYWLRISTLDKGHPVWIPLKLYKRAKQALAEYPKLCSGVTLNKRGDRWYATLVVEKRERKPLHKQVVGLDLGLKRVVADSLGHSHGEFSERLRRRVEQETEKRRRQQKLSACLRKKGLPEIAVSPGKAEAYARCEIGRALNQALDDLPKGAAVAIERLSVKDMRFETRRGNRWLKVSQLGYALDKLKFKLDERGVRYRSVQPSYSSQECSACGFTCRLNRPRQEQFHCLWCGFTCNADEQAARVLAERFGQDHLNGLSYRQVGGYLVARFLLGAAWFVTKGYPVLAPSILGSLQVGRSPTSGPDTLSKAATPPGKWARPGRPDSGQSARSSKNPTETFVAAGVGEGQRPEPSRATGPETHCNKCQRIR